MVVMCCSVSLQEIRSLAATLLTSTEKSMLIVDYQRRLLTVDAIDNRLIVSTL